MSELSAPVLLVTFLGGLVSFFSPCVAPLVPGYIGYLAGASGFASPSAPPSASPSASSSMTVALTDTHVWWRPPPTARVAALFVAGFSVAFVALGLLAVSFGTLFAAYKPVMETLVGIVMVVMGAFMLGLLPRQWTDLLLRERRVALPTTLVAGLGWLSPVALGVVFAAGWTPCIGPVLTTILAYVGASSTPGGGALLLGTYALGFAVPFLALGMGWTSTLRMARWMQRHARGTSRVTGMVLILLGLLYLSGEISVFAIWAQRFTPTLVH